MIKMLLTNLIAEKNGNLRKMDWKRTRYPEKRKKTKLFYLLLDEARDSLALKTNLK